MKVTLPEIVEYGRQAGSSRADGPNGHFVLTHNRVALAVIASNGLGWEHVSVHVLREQRCPTWEEMSWVKSLFWDEEETVVEFHPQKSAYVNIHATTLHLWRQAGCSYLLPPKFLV